MTQSWQTFVQQASEASLAAGVLVLLVLLIRRPVARFFGARTAYALWLIPVLRLAMPPIPVTEVVIEPAAPPTNEFITPAHTDDLPVLMAEVSTDDMPLAGDIYYISDTPDVAPITVSASTAPFWADWTWQRMILPFALLWAAGTLITFLSLIFQHTRFTDKAWRQTEFAEPDVKDLTEALRQKLNIHLPVSIRQCPYNDGPYVTGLCRRLIVVPSDFTVRFSRSEQEFALTHELMHLKRWDLPAIGVMLMVRATQWWNPAGKYLLRAFRSDQEAACDAAVLKRTAAHPHDYASTLMKAVRINETAVPALTLDHGLKERLRTMRIKNQLKGGTIAVLSLAALGLGSTASYAITQETRAVEAPEPPREPVPTEIEEIPEEEMRALREAEQELRESEREIRAQERELRREEHRLREKRKALEKQKQAERERARANGLENRASRQSRIVIDPEMDMDMDFGSDHVFVSPPAGFAYTLGTDDDVFMHDGEHMVVLTDPMEDVRDNLAKLSELKIGEIDIPEFVSPTVEVVEVKTVDGEIIKIPETATVFLPGRTKDIEAHAKLIEETIAKADIEGTVQAALGEDFEKKIDANVRVLKSLKASCDKHRLSSDKPKVFSQKNKVTGKNQKILCYSGDRTALISADLEEFVREHPDLTAAEKDRFMEARENKSYHFSFTTSDD